MSFPALPTHFRVDSVGRIIYQDQLRGVFYYKCTEASHFGGRFDVVHVTGHAIHNANHVVSIPIDMVTPYFRDEKTT